MPDPWAWSHETAAELWGLPVPEPWRPGIPLVVSRPTDSAPVRRPGIRGVRGLESRSTTAVAGMPCIGRLHTWWDLASELSLIDLVVMGDAVVGRALSFDEDRVGVDPVAELRLEGERRGGRRGSRRARQALALIRRGSGSPMETRVRLRLSGEGLPEPRLNRDIHGSGLWLATGDFVWEEHRVILEYQGDHHRSDRRQWQHDVTRHLDLQEAGWTVLLMTSADFFSAHRWELLVGRLRRALGMPA
ncbi:MAG TPA: DUF559 domain-containing protein [Dermatophilaceae bacterium]|nr:DUF559 domain-containing protein [Dermatophilaceae bacterium]